MFRFSSLQKRDVLNTCWAGLAPKAIQNGVKGLVKGQVEGQVKKAGARSGERPGERAGGQVKEQGKGPANAC